MGPAAVSIEALMTQPVTVVHRATGTPDGEGNPEPGATTSTDYLGCIQQIDSVEVLEGERLTSTNLLLFLPTSAAITAEDELTSGSDRYRVVGYPNVVRTPRGPHHIEAHLRLVV